MQVGWSGLALQLYVYVAIAFQLYLTVVYVAIAFGRFSVVRLCRFASLRFSSFTTSLSVPRKEPIEKVCRLVNEIN